MSENRLHQSATSLLITITILIVSLFTTDGSAEEEKYLLQKENWEQLSEINKLLENGQNSQAISKLNAFIPTIKNIPYDTAVAQQTLGYAYQANKNYAKAISSFKKAINTKALPYNVNHELYFNLAQLLIHSQQYKEGLSYFERWIKNEKKPDLNAYLLAGTAYYQSKQFKKTIPYAKKIIQLKNKYDEDWHQVLVSCYITVGQYENAAKLLEKMINRQPENKHYWQQLLANWQHANNDHKTLATMELMYTRGLFNSEDIRQLVTMYLYLDLPYKGAKLIQTEMEKGTLAKALKNWELLGNSWLQAKERVKAAQVLSNAAQLSNHGKYDFQIGHIYFDMEDYAQAITHLETSLKKGNLKDPAKAYLLIGIAAFHEKNYTRSRTALETAMRNKNKRNLAEWWLERIEDLGKENS